MIDEDVLADLVDVGGHVIARSLPVWIFGQSAQGYPAYAMFSLGLGVLGQGEPFRLTTSDGRRTVFAASTLAREEGGDTVKIMAHHMGGDLWPSTSPPPGGPLLV